MGPNDFNDLCVKLYNYIKLLFFHRGENNIYVCVNIYILSSSAFSGGIVVIIVKCYDNILHFIFFVLDNPTVHILHLQFNPLLPNDPVSLHHD